LFVKIRKSIYVSLFLVIAVMTTGCLGIFQRDYSLSVTYNAEQGNVEGIPEKANKIKKDTIVELTAIPKSGYMFSTWEGVPEELAKENPIEIVMNSNMDITAIFVERVGPTPTYKVDLIYDSQEGTVRGLPENPESIEEGTEITLTAVANEGFLFDKWIGVPGTKEKENPLTITVLGDMEIKAQFSSVVVKQVEDFEDFEIGHEFLTLGWSPEDADAVVAVDPLNPDNKVLKFTPRNYGAVPVIEMSLPEGKTLADYSSFTFKGYFAEGDVGWKNIFVAVFTETPSGPGDGDDNKPAHVGEFFRGMGGSSGWEEIVIEIDGSSEITGDIYVGFGMSTAADAEGVPTLWYVDDVKFVQ